MYFKYSETLLANDLIKHKFGCEVMDPDFLKNKIAETHNSQSWF